MAKLYNPGEEAAFVAQLDEQQLNKMHREVQKTLRALKCEEQRCPYYGETRAANCACSPMSAHYHG